MSRHKPDHEMEIMRRGLRALADLPPEGQRRVLAYWNARAPSLPVVGEAHGEQQLDIEEALPGPRFKGAA